MCSVVSKGQEEVRNLHFFKVGNQYILLKPKRPKTRNKNMFYEYMQ